jgi:hypothetical protein
MYKFASKGGGAMGSTNAAAVGWQREGGGQRKRNRCSVASLHFSPTHGRQRKILFEFIFCRLFPWAR